MVKTSRTPRLPELSNPLQDFVSGRRTLAELEGIPKNHQYEMAKTGFHKLAAGKLEDAREIFLGLLALDPSDAYFHGALGVVAQQLGEPGVARRHLDKSIALNPYVAYVWVHRAEVRLGQGELTAAVEDLSRALALDETRRDPATRRAQAILQAIASIGQ
jgi:tetratricopeptide (TPR) repeat protein